MRSFSFACGFTSLLLLAGTIGAAHAQTTYPWQSKERIHGLVAMGVTRWIGVDPVDVSTGAIMDCTDYGTAPLQSGQFPGEGDCTDNNFTLNNLSTLAPGIFDGIVLNFGWWQLEPGQRQYDFTAINNALLNVAKYNQANPGHQLKVRLRIWPGVYAPIWAKDLTGTSGTMTASGPIEIYQSADGESQGNTVHYGLWWTPEYRSAWRNFMTALAAAYDVYTPPNNSFTAYYPEIADVTNSSCSTQTDEPFIGINDATSISTMVKVGYSLHAYEWCLADSINDYTAWTHTAVEFPTSAFHINVSMLDSTYKSGTDYSPGGVDYGTNVTYLDNDGSLHAFFPQVTQNIMTLWENTRGNLYEPANHGLHSLHDMKAVVPNYMPSVGNLGYSDSSSFSYIYPKMADWGGSGGPVNFQTMYPLKNEIPTKLMYDATNNPNGPITTPLYLDPNPPYTSANDAVAQAIDFNASSIELWGSTPSTIKNELRPNPVGWEGIIRSELQRWQGEFNGQTSTGGQGNTGGQGGTGQ